MRILILVLAAMAYGSCGYATVDVDPDQLGIYFDVGADQTCFSVGPSVPFSVYVVLTNPSQPEVVGFEFGYRVAVPPGTEDLVFRLQNASGCWNWEVDPWYESDYVCGLASPIPLTGSNAVLVIWQFMLLVPGITMEFYLGPAVVESIVDGLPAYASPDGIFPLGVSSGDVNLPVAMVNTDCSVVAVDHMSFGELKSLYR
jgi:hypothetical protein